MRERFLQTPENTLFFKKEKEGLLDVCPLFKGQGFLNKEELLNFFNECSKTPGLTEEIRALYRRADDILYGGKIGDLFWNGQLELRRKALGKKSEERVSLLELEDADLLNTAIAQPATFIFNEANRMAEERVNGKDSIKPMYYLGNSLGEYNAFLATGGFKSEDGPDGKPDGGFKNALNLIKRRGRLMHEICRDKKGNLVGGLIAVTIPRDLIDKEGSTEEQKKYFGDLIEFLKKRNRKNHFRLYVEADNSDTQVVFAGKTEDLNRASEWISKNCEGKVKAVRLAVEGAFHCELMKQAEKDFARTVRWYLKKGLIKDLNTEVIANTTAIPIKSADEVAAEMIRHLTKSVLWRQSTEYAKKRGAAYLIEYGKKAVLTKMEDPKTVDIIKGAAIGGAALALLVGVFAVYSKVKKR
ncbi:MAG: ACP S-malonyltransferase [bacterium]|nr:ACP S-malonyltransferase [bacterium]